LFWLTPGLAMQAFLPHELTGDTALSQTVKHRRKVPMASWKCRLLTVN
jgi:hypothetical protein